MGWDEMGRAIYIGWGVLVLCMYGFGNGVRWVFAICDVDERREMMLLYLHDGVVVGCVCVCGLG